MVTKLQKDVTIYSIIWEVYKKYGRQGFSDLLLDETKTCITWEYDHGIIYDMYYITHILSLDAFGFGL